MSTTTVSPSARLLELLPQLGQASQQDGDAYLRFQLLNETMVLMPMVQVREAILVSAEQITPIPNLSQSVIGLMSSRDSVFGVIDLSQILDTTSVPSLSRQYQVIVANVQGNDAEDALLGFAVGKIQGVSRFSEGTIQSSGDHNFPGLQPYLLGVLKDGDLALPVLDAQIIGSANALSV